MSIKLANRYNPYAREVLDDLFLVDEEFDNIDTPFTLNLRNPVYMN